jgi:general secretion pathway protein I
MTQRGFILLDVLLALAVLAIALPVLLGLASRDIELLGHARALTAATLLAQEKLFESEAEGFPPVGLQTGDFQLPSSHGLASEQQIDDRRRAFRWTRTVDATALEDVREVRVRISWPRGRLEEMVEVTSYVFLEPKTSPSSRLYPD